MRKLRKVTPEGGGVIRDQADGRRGNNPRAMSIAAMTSEDSERISTGAAGRRASDTNIHKPTQLARQLKMATTSWMRRLWGRRWWLLSVWGVVHGWALFVWIFDHDSLSRALASITFLNVSPATRIVASTIAQAGLILEMIMSIRRSMRRMVATRGSERQS